MFSFGFCTIIESLVERDQCKTDLDLSKLSIPTKADFDTPIHILYIRIISILVRIGMKFMSRLPPAVICLWWLGAKQDQAITVNNICKIADLVRHNVAIFWTLRCDQHREICRWTETFILTSGFNTYRPSQNGRRFKTTFSNAFSLRKMYEFRLKFHSFVPMVPIDNMPVLVQISAPDRRKAIIRTNGEITDVCMRQSASVS